MAKNNASWQAIFDKLKVLEHDFEKKPFQITADEIKACVQSFKKTSQKEVRILCKQDTREDRPQVFIDNNLFILPVKNGTYAICKGEGYVDIPNIISETEVYYSKLDFDLISSTIGDSEMQYLDYAYASSLIRTFMNDPSLVLTIRGRKYTPHFYFDTDKYKNIESESVQTEVDAGFEGKNRIVLIEAKNKIVTNEIIRQIYYPMRQWAIHTNKAVSTLFFEKRGDEFLIWEFAFKDVQNYNSIYLKQSKKFKIIKNNL